ncbi:FAD-dependent oxidoreductase [Chloroflexota bacterium]
MSQGTLFENLFKPAQIGEMSIRNRIVMAPMGTRLASADGLVTERQKGYYEKRARGGVGLIIVETSYIDSIGSMANWLAVDNDRVIPGLSQLTEVVHRHGAKIALQLNHAGRLAKSDYIHQQSVAPSPVASERDGEGIPGTIGEIPRELTAGDIADIVVRFARAAERAKASGFDGVEIHAAHGYLLARFISASSNRRQDAYGGELQNRVRMLLEVIRAVKASAGQSYPVWCRINGREFGTVDGNTREEGQQVARLAQEAGVDAIHVSAFGSGRVIHSPMALPSGYLAFLAEGIKKVVTIPVIAVGRINTPEAAESILQEGKADLVAMGRALIADPELPNKATAGRLKDIRPCIACQNCFGGKDPLTCTVNPAVGKERAFSVRPAEKRKKVLVLGGGPAGMEGARVASLRGHSVVLCERDFQLGGQLNLAALPPHKSVIRNLQDYLVAQIEKSDVKVMLEKEAAPELIREMSPDVVIVCTGSSPSIPEIPGIRGTNVVTFVDVLRGNMEVGERVFVIGGEFIGCETAEWLAEKGKKVTVATLEPDMIALTKVSHLIRQPLLNRLADMGVTMLAGVRYEEITREGLIIIDGKGRRQTIEADTVVLAAGSRPNVEIYEELKGKVPEIYLAGDCIEPRWILESLAEGWQIAQKV